MDSRNILEAMEFAIDWMARKVGEGKLAPEEASEYFAEMNKLIFRKRPDDCRFWLY